MIVSIYIYLPFLTNQIVDILLVSDDYEHGRKAWAKKMAVLKL